MLELLPHDPDDAFTCVELGCGSATLTDRVLARFRRASAIAIDSEPAMLAVARRKLSKYGARVQAREGQAMTCELPSCDMVLSSFMFHHLPPEAMKATLRHIAKALTPGGCFILLDQMTAGPAWGSRVGQQGWKLVRRHTAEAVVKGMATQDEVDARFALKRRMKEEGRDVEYRHAAEDILRLMGEAGFGETGLVWRQFASTILMGLRG